MQGFLLRVYVFIFERFCSTLQLMMLKKILTYCDGPDVTVSTHAFLVVLKADVTLFSPFFENEFICVKKARLVHRNNGILPSAHGL